MRAPLVAFACLLAAATCKIRVPAGQGEAAGDFPCERAEECPAPPNACLLSACWEAQCVFVPAPEGTLPPEAQVPGDCKERYCDGNGEIGEGRAMRDLPPEDGNPCTESICDLDVPKQAPRIAGTRCGDGICNGTGICGECLPKAARCEGNAVSTCSAEGAWSAALACEALEPRCHRAACVGVAEIDAGAARACARFSDGSVVCWGAPPGEPTSAPDLVGIDVGPRHACGLKNGEVYCWGVGDWGQLGQGRYASSATPVPTGIRATRVAVGRDHSCALRDDGTVACWGRNDRGQLGSGTPAPEPEPELSGGGGGSGQALLAVDKATGLSLDGEQLCVAFGPNRDCWSTPRFALPPDFEPPEDAPDGASASDPATAAKLAQRRKVSSAVPLSAPLSAAALDCGHDHCCARMADDSVRCWGDGTHGQLGSAAGQSAAPVPIAAISASKIALGATFACALTGDTVTCWGDDRHRQLGRDGTSPSGPPGTVSLPGPARDVVAGDAFACAHLTTGAVFCWGRGDAPQPIAW